MNRFLQDSEGSTLVEFTLVFPLFMLVAFGTVDFTYMLFEWDMANKAAYIGARTAVVSNPVASGITNPTLTAAQIAQLGQTCFIVASGAADTNVNCPTTGKIDCTPAASAGPSDSCGSYTFDNTAFTAILTKMQTVFPRLRRQNVQISYQTNGLGFMGRPSSLGGLPMDVTVSIRCMTHQFFFLSALMGWAFPALPAGCPAAPAGPAIPAFATTLPSEDMVTN